MAKPKATSKKSAADEVHANKRKYVSQSDVPSYGLEEALKIPQAIVDEYGGDPTRPLSVAKALDMAPTSPSFRMRCGAAMAYGVTEGGYNATQIVVLPLGKRIVSPTVEGDEILAKREAFLKPRVLGLFLTKYDGSRLPREDIAVNVLQEMGVAKDATKKTFTMIVDGAKSLGLLTQIKDALYVNLKGVKAGVEKPAADVDDELAVDEPEGDKTPEVSAAAPSVPSGGAPPETPARHEFRRKRVFITHGKDKAFIEPIKKLLGFGELEPVVSVERQTVSLAVPEKVMSDMRSCGAAIIHVDAELRLIDDKADEHVVLNPNVLIEIGAAMALYGKRFILLVRDGVKLPSNLQGVFEVRYSSDALDGNATIRLLEAINDIKNHPLPE
jgi:hypothetical protein